jgi:L-ascorbate metabolism protein UlaG (beta-lactamase superfamily)
VIDVAVTHSSTACVLLEIGSMRILTDPVLDDGSKSYRLGPLAWATREVGPSIRPDQLAPLDAVLLSHAHHLDNLDETGKGILHEATQVITGLYGARHLDVKTVGLAPWQETTISGKNGEQVRVTATPARHGPWWVPGTANVVGFVLQWEGQEHGVLYISGDTVFFRGIRQIAKRFRIGTALWTSGPSTSGPPGRHSSALHSTGARLPGPPSCLAPNL